MGRLTDWLKDIRFWIMLFFLVRLIGITQPPLEVAHNWRQTTVTMVARNFYEVDNNIFYPRIDIAGNKTGITGMEFPILNYLIYLVSEVFGYQHWYGRLINLLLSSFGIFFFFKLVRRYFNPEIAFNATLILLGSVWFAYARKIMPDTFSMSLVMIGIYYGLEYLLKEIPKIGKELFFYFVLILVGTLSKLPSAYLLSLFLIPFLNKKIALKPKIIFAGISVLALIPSIIWYFYWVPYLVERYQFWHFFMGVSLWQGILDIWENIGDTLQKFYDVALKFVGFGVFLLGLGFSIFKKEKLLLAILGISFFSFLLIMFKSGYTFPHHSYYIIPFVPIMALVAGYAVQQFDKKWIQIVLLLAIGLEGTLNQLHDFRVKPAEEALIHLEQDLHQVANKEDLILINSGKYPTPMYFSHHKGWLAYNEKIQDKSYIQQLKTEGLKYILILKKTFGTDIGLDYIRVFDNEHYAIYKI